MRQWSGGPVLDTEAALTGTSRRQKTLPRVVHNHQDENVYEPMNPPSEKYDNYRTNTLFTSICCLVIGYVLPHCIL